MFFFILFFVQQISATLSDDSDGVVIGLSADSSLEPILAWDSTYFSSSAIPEHSSNLNAKDSLDSRGYARSDHDRMALSMVICEEDGIEVAELDDEFDDSELPSSNGLLDPGVK